MKTRKIIQTIWWEGLTGATEKAVYMDPDGGDKTWNVPLNDGRLDDLGREVETHYWSHAHVSEAQLAQILTYYEIEHGGGHWEHTGPETGLDYHCYDADLWTPREVLSLLGLRIPSENTVTHNEAVYEAASTDLTYLPSDADAS